MKFSKEQVIFLIKENSIEKNILDTIPDQPDFRIYINKNCYEISGGFDVSLISVSVEIYTDNQYISIVNNFDDNRYIKWSSLINTLIDWVEDNFDKYDLGGNNE